jgi:hypothetical protein
MTDVKAQELSYDGWRELLEPYGWADIRTYQPAFLAGPVLGFMEYEIRVMLKGSPDGALDEWAHRSYLLDQARQAVEAVKAKGYWLSDAPRVEFGGRYRFRVDRDTVPEWDAEAELRFTVRPR